MEVLTLVLSTLHADHDCRFTFVSADLVLLNRLKNLKLLEDDDMDVAYLETNHPTLCMQWNSNITELFLKTAFDDATGNQYDTLMNWISLNTKNKKHDPANDYEKDLIDWASSTVSLEEFETRFKSRLLSSFPTKEKVKKQSEPFETKVHARIGLIGNPSDGFYGKTISCIIKNYWATCFLVPNPDPYDTTVQFQPSTISDTFYMPTIKAGVEWTDRNGYNGTLRLFSATITVFYRHLTQKNLISQEELNKHSGFKAHSITNIPRQVGLAGSSALVMSFLKSFIKFYNVDIPPHIQANLALSAEVDELGIAAGHQDRVIQAFGGCVFMDFNKDFMLGRGFGNYVPLDPQLLPKIWIGNSTYIANTIIVAYIKDPKESGKVHSDVKARFAKGDPVVLQAMTDFASYADKCRDALESKRVDLIPALFTANIECRRRLYGDAVVGAQTLKIIEIARSFGCAAKLSGSGGCVIGIPLDVNDECKQVRLKLQKEGYIFSWLQF